MKKLFLASIAAAFVAPCTYAEGPPSNWPWRSWPSDHFSWFNNAKWRKDTYKNPNNSDDFRKENVRIVG